MFFIKITYAAEYIVAVTPARAVVECSHPSINNVDQRYLLLEAPNSRMSKGILLLLIGGDGKLDMEDSQLDVTSSHFLLRSRYLFAARGYHVAVMDAATDVLSCKKGLLGRRASPAYAKDIFTVVVDLKARFPNLEISLVGFGHGGLAAAQAGMSIKRIKSIVLVSPASTKGPSVLDLKLKKIKIPVLITFHEKDACQYSPPANVSKIVKSLSASTLIEVKSYDFRYGSFRNNHCDPISTHGYLGGENTVVKDILDWIEKI